MNKKIDNDEAERLLAGTLPEGRPELRDLADAITAVRMTAASAPLPVPTALLVDRLSGQPIASISTMGEAEVASPVPAGGASGTVRRPALIEGVRGVMEWISGLGLTSKIAIGLGVVVFGTAGVGAAGALPGPAQSAFDTIVSTISGTESGLDDDPPPYVDDESDLNDDPARPEESELDVDDDPAPFVDDESDVDDDPAPYVEDESDVDDDPVRQDEDESDVNDDPVRQDEDESDVNDDPAPSVEDESDVDDDPAPSAEDESDVDDDAHTSVEDESDDD